jgi:hypothetical protein
MELAWSIVPIVGAIAGALVMIFAFLKRKQKFTVFSDIDGVVKQDWVRTGNIDFHIAELEMMPQLLALRVEEKKITENVMGQDIVQLRWRLATVEEAKEVVVFWNTSTSERTQEFRGALLKSA